MKRKRFIFQQSMYIISLAIVAALFVLYWLLSHASIYIQVNPKSSYILINNAPVQVSQRGVVKKTLTPGEYNIKIEADGYVSHIENITLKRLQRKTLKITLKEVPIPETVSAGASFLSKDKDFNSFVFLGDNGKTLYRASMAATKSGVIETRSILPMTEPKLKGIQEIVWSPNRDLALFRKSDGVYLFDFKKYDFVNQTETLWGQDIGSIAWSPDNSKIAYYYGPANGERSLIFSNIANTEMTRILNFADLNITNPILRWSPDSEWLLIIPRDQKDYNLNRVYAFSAYTKTLNELTDSGSQINAMFSPDSNKILYTTYSKDQNNPVSSLVSIMDKDGSNKRILDTRADISKIAWKKDGDILIIASYNEKKKRESIFGFNVKTKATSGFSFDSLNVKYIDSLAISDDNKIVVYEANKTIYAILNEQTDF